MSPIAVGLDLLLIALLVTALVVGLRLNGQLRRLRDGQAGFVKAVGELDAAAARAESGLKMLRTASETTHDELLTRIETARALISRLDAANAAAAKLAEAAPVAAAPRPAALARPAAPAPQATPRAEARLDPRFRSAPAPSARELDDELFAAEPRSPRTAADLSAPVSPRESLSELRRRLGGRG